MCSNQSVDLCIRIIFKSQFESRKASARASPRHKGEPEHPEPDHDAGTGVQPPEVGGRLAER